ncbi:hypothetical protein CEXT_117871 [Caerostris extrusa]|uniref:Uncharacterized protein n=1 Tax=Caerostris extrusa TaxID=172846 RepID=A0AAV4WFL0_CAEEX|nr:hypothetical protein CEXT_117871 [Caerostris extrusa]
MPAITENRFLPDIQSKRGDFRRETLLFRAAKFDFRLGFICGFYGAKETFQTDITFHIILSNDGVLSCLQCHRHLLKLIISIAKCLINDPGRCALTSFRHCHSSVSLNASNNRESIIPQIFNQSEEIFRRETLLFRAAKFDFRRVLCVAFMVRLVPTCLYHLYHLVPTCLPSCIILYQLVYTILYHLVPTCLYHHLYHLVLSIPSCIILYQLVYTIFYHLVPICPYHYLYHLVLSIPSCTNLHIRSIASSIAISSIPLSIAILSLPTSITILSITSCIIYTILY